ncbi:trypsin-like peptidase domain-containing protein, partial [Rhodococcus opacus]
MTEDRNSHDGNSRDNAGGDQGVRPDQPAHPQAAPGHHPTEQFPAAPQHPTGGPMGQQAYGAGYPQGNPYGVPHQPTQQFGQPQHGAPGHPGAQHAAGQHGAPQGPFPGLQGPGQAGEGSTATATKRPARTAIVVGAVALALVSGGIGGVVGSLATERNGSGAAVTNSLDAPKNNTATPAANAPAGSVQAVANKVVPSVVQIEVATAGGSGGEGSGIVISSDGMILTNNHVAGAAAKGGKLTVAFSDGSTADAKLVGADPVS